MKVVMQPSLHSCPIDTRDPTFRWGKVCNVLSDWVNTGFRLSSGLWVACMMLMSGSMTWGPCDIGCLLLHGVFTLM